LGAVAAVEEPAEAAERDVRGLQFPAECKRCGQPTSGPPAPLGFSSAACPRCGGLLLPATVPVTEVLLQVELLGIDARIEPWVLERGEITVRVRVAGRYLGTFSPSEARRVRDRAVRALV
jgi:hypothetical protein